jgi:hypothetical protein
MIVFVIISIITLLSGVLYTFFWMFTLIKFMIVKYLYATIICKYDQRRNHGLVVYEYEIDANGQNIHVKGPQNINFNPLFHDQLNVGDKVRVKYDSKRNKILSKLGTILFYLLLVSLIGIIMFMFVRIMML